MVTTASVTTAPVQPASAIPDNPVDGAEGVFQLLLDGLAPAAPAPEGVVTDNGLNETVSAAESSAESEPDPAMEMLLLCGAPSLSVPLPAGGVLPEAQVESPVSIDTDAGALSGTAQVNGAFSGALPAGGERIQNSAPVNIEAGAEASGEAAQLGRMFSDALPAGGERMHDDPPELAQIMPQSLEADAIDAGAMRADDAKASRDNGVFQSWKGLNNESALSAGSSAVTGSGATHGATTEGVTKEAASNAESSVSSRQQLETISASLPVLNSWRRDQAASGDIVPSPEDTTTMATQLAGTQFAADIRSQTVESGVAGHQVSEHIRSRVGTQHWATELGNKLTLMTGREVQSATLYLTPADLGPVQVRIEAGADQTSVWFTAEHPDTRSALEQSLPRLRELFSAQGMSLADAGVFDSRDNQARQSQAEPQNAPTSVFDDFRDEEALADTATVRTLSLSLLDAYA